MDENATEEQAAEAEGPDLGGQLRSAVGRLYRRFRSERPEGDSTPNPEPGSSVG